MNTVKPASSGGTTEASSTAETHPTKPGSQSSTTRGSAYRQYETEDLPFLTPPFGSTSGRTSGSTSASQVNSGESSSTTSPEPQEMLLPGYWKGQYIRKAEGDKSAKSWAELQANPKGKPDYWAAYSGCTSPKAKPKAGTPRKLSKVNEMIQNPFSDLNKQLGAPKDQQSIAVYKSIDNKYQNPDGTWNIEGHVGDEDQAANYYKGDGQTLLKMTLKPGAHELLFSPKYMALAPSGAQNRAMAELAMMEGKGKYPLTPQNGEGTLAGYIGVKPEGGGQKFSLGIGKSNASEALFKHFVATWEEGRKGADGKWEPKG